MGRDINFVQQRRKKLTKQQKQDFKIFRVSAIAFACGLLVFAIVLSVYFFLQLRINNTLNEQTRIEQSVLRQENIEKSILITNEKLNVLIELFDLRYDKQAAIAFFSNLFGDQVLIQDINYEAEERILSLKIKAPSVFVMDRVFEQLNQPQIKEEFGTVNKSQLNRSSDGTYNMTITMTLEKTNK